MKFTIFVAILLICHRATSAPQSSIFFGNENLEKVIISTSEKPKEKVEITDQSILFGNENLEKVIVSTSEKPKNESEITDNNEESITAQQPDKIEVFISTEDIYNQALESCATNSSTPFDMPYYDRKQKGYVCHTLLTKGPCVHHENWWLVLDKESTLAKCLPKKCVQEEKTYDFIQFGDDCVDPKDLDSVEKNCGVNQKLGLNPFGEGVCECANGFLEVYDQDNNLSCQLEYCQGICEEGFHHEMEETGDIPIPVCFPSSENDKEKCKDQKLNVELGVRQLISGGDLDTVCPDGQHRDETDGRCVKTWQRGLGNQADILAYLEWRRTQNGK